MSSSRQWIWCALALVVAAGCGGSSGATTPSPDVDAEEPARQAPAEDRPRRRVDNRPPPMARPVPLWENGESTREIDAATADVNGYLLLDLGESWTPYIFTERDGETGERIPHAYRETYLALARGELPDDNQGARAARDKYLELYGIMPTLGLLRSRFREVRDLACREELDLAPLEAYDGFTAYRSNPAARRDASRFARLERQVNGLVEDQQVASEAELDVERLDERDARKLRDYRDERPRVLAIRAAQARLECEGFFEGKGSHIDGAMDWSTHEALAEFERRHRVYGWGFLGGETLERLREPPMELERRALVRVLTERAMHALGVLEDGSTERDGQPRTYRGLDQREHPVPNLEHELETRITSALGLTTPEGALDFLEGLGELTPGAERVVAIEAPELPEYYSDDMDIRVQIDRGDVWYDFPYDDEGRERAQPVERRPRLTVFVEYEGQRIPIARYGTTIGGWRSEVIDGVTWWKYKGSPTGPRVWKEIVSAPVWLPPESTPADDLLSRVPGRSGADAWRVNYHETGPSYASAYGLVAAYHLRFREDADGTIRLGGDEGIRTHGSVDYMSIMRRHSHGCHRLHNHIAVRLMSWVLEHRRHRRVGHEDIGFRRNIEHEGHTYQMAIDRGGYIFELERPIVVDVLEGRVRGSREAPIDVPLPRYDDVVGAYLLPDGGAVRVSRAGEMTRYALPDAGLDGGVPDGGVLNGGRPDGGIINPFASE